MPHLRLPSLPAVAMLFLAYALTIGPITYWILSRMNRREWAWWIIPSLGIAATLGIYTYGKIVRGDEVLVHNLAYVETKTSGEAGVLGVSGFITQEAGTYRLEGSPEMWMWPFHGEGKPLRGGGIRSAVGHLPRRAPLDPAESVCGDRRNLWVGNSAPSPAMRTGRCAGK